VREAPPLPIGPISPTGAQYELRHGDQSAIVTEVGATLRAYTVGGTAILDGFAPDTLPTGGRGQVLMPWPNRVAGGRYTFAGQQHQLALSEARAQNASHGLVRWANWTLAAQAANRAVLRLVLHPQSGYPFALALELAYTLDDHGLTVRATARNVGTGAAPFGVGFHPYFTTGTPTIDDAILTVPANTTLATDERMIPTGHVAMDNTPLDFRAPRPLGDTHLDTCYTNLIPDADGRARITLAGPSGTPRITLTLDPAFRFAQLYSGDNLPAPDRRRGLAIEPMTCPANAFNSGDGLLILDPGQTFTASWSIHVA